jgi:hypothetical protein
MRRTIELLQYKKNKKVLSFCLVDLDEGGFLETLLNELKICADGEAGCWRRLKPWLLAWRRL